MRVYAVDQPDLPPLEMPGRFRTDVAYFMTPVDSSDVPRPATNEYWVRQSDARQWLEEGVVLVVSPLDAAAKAEIELSEEQEAWLEWMIEHGIERIRLED
jgi:hypothetical protein